MTAKPRRPIPSVGTAIVGAVIGRPDLWWAALGALRRLAAPGWWRNRPYLPLPDPRLWSFRMVTAYGRAEADPEVSDVISYLEWSRSTSGRRRINRGGRATDPPTGRLDRIRSG